MNGKCCSVSDGLGKRVWEVPRARTGTATSSTEASRVVRFDSHDSESRDGDGTRYATRYATRAKARETKKTLTRERGSRSVSGRTGTPSRELDLEPLEVRRGLQRRLRALLSLALPHGEKVAGKVPRRALKRALECARGAEVPMSETEMKERSRQFWEPLLINYVFTQLVLDYCSSPLRCIIVSAPRSRSTRVASARHCCLSKEERRDPQTWKETCPPEAFGDPPGACAGAKSGTSFEEQEGAGTSANTRGRHPRWGPGGLEERGRGSTHALRKTRGGNKKTKREKTQSRCSLALVVSRVFASVCIVFLTSRVLGIIPSIQKEAHAIR